MTVRKLAVFCLILSVFCLLPLICVLTPYAYFQVLDIILPNVQVGSVAVGGMSLQEATQRIDQFYNQRRRIQISDGMRVWYLAPVELGLLVDAPRTTQLAFDYGHGTDLIKNLIDLFQSFGKKHIVSPVTILDTNQAARRLQQLNEEVRQLPKPPTIFVESGQVKISEGEIGYEINLEETLHKMIANPQGIIETGELKLFLKPIPAPSVDIEEAATQLNTFIQRGEDLTAYDPITDEWLKLSISREIISRWIQADVVDQQVRLRLSEEQVKIDINTLGEGLGGNRDLDPDKVAPLIIRQIETGEKVFIRVNHKPTSYTVQQGDTMLKIAWKLGFPMWKILEANPGLDPDRLYAGQVLTIPSKDELLPLEVIPNKRILISISKQRLLVYENGKQIKKFVISTGIDRSPTQPGVFQILTHKANAYASVWDLYMPNFLGIYEAWPGFMNGIHGLPTLSNGTRLWANVLGRPASYGCIILDLPDSKFLYNWAENGVVVEILP
ncbi:MAG: L,D-transpeptidase family protein [Anaerolineales bacterium]|nr:L,D-transpeptidase family protein [Anaerolineales bacterium]